MDKKSAAGKKRKRRRRTRERVLAVAFMVLGILFGIVLLIVLLWLGMENMGKSRLRAEAGRTPEGMEAGLKQTAEEETRSGTEADTLQAGEVRYQGQTYVYKENILTFLFMGIDKKTEVEAADDRFQGGQADALFLAVLDTDESSISVIGVNRDTMAEVQVYDSGGLYAGTSVEQIALAHAYGEGLEDSCENTVEAVSRLFYGLPIHGYCAINMGAISMLNDAVDGVEVTIPESMDGFRSKNNGAVWKTGDHVHLMGEDSYHFIHDRDVNVARSAEARLERQKEYLSAYIRKAMGAVKKDLTLPVTLYQTLSPYMVTDVSLDEAVYLAGQAISCTYSEDRLYSMEGEVRMGEKFEEFYPDETALYELILEVFYEKEAS